MKSTSTLPLIAAVLACEPVQRAAPVWVTIPHGATIDAIADSLATHDLVGSAGSFRWYARFSGMTDSLKAGSYELHAGMSPRAIVDELRRGQPFANALGIPAGLWLPEIAGYVARQLRIPPDSFLLATRDSTALARVGAHGPTLEGYLLPGDYRVRAGATAREVVHVMLDAFERRWRAEWNLRLDTLELSRDDVVILASIVEGEGGATGDAATIASVYHNRLRRGMRLQADPTVVYALAQRRRLFNEDYRVPSSHNTYLISGLPPTPIGNPSIASLEATLYPAATDFLYFVASADGGHRFSRTYTEHLRTIRSLRNAGGREDLGR